jgi:hypothetical protein
MKRIKSQPPTDRCPKCNNLWRIHDCPIISGGANPQPPTEPKQYKWEENSSNEKLLDLLQPPTDEGWEKRFDKKCDKTLTEEGFRVIDLPRDEIKDFIRKVRQEAIDETYKQMKKSKIATADYNYKAGYDKGKHDGLGYCIGEEWNEAQLKKQIRAETIKEIENIMNNMFHNKEANNNAYEFFQQIKVKINKLK